MTRLRPNCLPKRRTAGNRRHRAEMHQNLQGAPIAIVVLGGKTSGEYALNANAGVGNHGSRKGEVRVDVPAITGIAVKLDGVIAQRDRFGVFTAAKNFCKLQKCAGNTPLAGSDRIRHSRVPGTIAGVRKTMAVRTDMRRWGGSGPAILVPDTMKPCSDPGPVHPGSGLENAAPIVRSPGTQPDAISLGQSRCRRERTKRPAGASRRAAFHSPGLSDQKLPRPFGGWQACPPQVTALARSGLNLVQARPRAWFRSVAN